MSHKGLLRGGTTYLEAGDVWKYGETTNPENRYTQKWLTANRLDFKPEYAGTQVQIKVVEKVKIYGHVFEKGQLPPRK
nr:hypothetical protein [uncultured Desulfobacter sp.]